MTNNSWTAGRRRLPGRAAVLCLAFPVALVGCGGGDLASVNGKLTYKGAPVKGGTVTFSPVGSGKYTAGKAASAEVQADGTYTLGTYSDSDGARIGRHRVTYTPPAQELTEQQRSDPKYIAPPPPYLGLAPKQAEVEVKVEDNNIDIELVPARRK
jgi:hypothetical protein